MAKISAAHTFQGRCVDCDDLHRLTVAGLVPVHSRDGAQCLGSGSKPTPGSYTDDAGVPTDLRPDMFAHWEYSGRATERALLGVVQAAGVGAAALWASRGFPGPPQGPTNALLAVAFGLVVFVLFLGWTGSSFRARVLLLLPVVLVCGLGVLNSDLARGSGGTDRQGSDWCAEMRQFWLDNPYDSNEALARAYTLEC